MRTLKIYYAGEGPTELGDLANPPQYRQEPPRMGVLQALVSRVSSVPTEAINAKIWKSIQVVRPGERRGHDERRVLRLRVLAEEAGADVVVFSRDRDRDEDREAEIERGISEMERDTKVVGGIAREAIEAWVLAFQGERGSEQHSKPKVPLAKQFGISCTEAMVECIATADLEELPPDSRSLKLWLERARKHLTGAAEANGESNR